MNVKQILNKYSACNSDNLNILIKESERYYGVREAVYTWHVMLAAAEVKRWH